MSSRFIRLPLPVSPNSDESGKQSLYPDGDPDRHRNLIVCSLTHCQSCVKISCKSVVNFLRKVANSQTNEQRRKHVLLGGGNGVQTVSLYRNNESQAFVSQPNRCKILIRQIILYNVRLTRGKITYSDGRTFKNDLRRHTPCVRCSDDADLLEVRRSAVSWLNWVFGRNRFRLVLSDATLPLAKNSGSYN